MEQDAGTGIQGRSMGSAVGVFFASWFLEAIGGNVLLAFMYGMLGAGGSLLGSIIIAVLWKNGTFDAHGGAKTMVITSLIVGVVATFIVLSIEPHLYAMRYGG